MIEKPLDTITRADLDALVRTGRSEGRRLDFKAAFPGAGEKAVKDFLADVTAFANTDGGDIIVGVEEDGNGQALEVVGIDPSNLDADLLRIEGQIRDCVDPRITGFHVHQVELDEGRVALVMRTASSLSAPHRVTYKGSSRFHGRNSRGNYELDTLELRQAFVASEELPQKLRELHSLALQKRSGRDMPCELPDRPTLVVTVAPMSIIREKRDLGFDHGDAVLPPVRPGEIADIRIGLDGVVAFSTNTQDSSVGGWAISHRRGYIDFAWTIGRVRDERQLVFRGNVDGYLQGSVRSALARLSNHGLVGPWIVMATIVGAQGYQVICGDDYLTDAAWQNVAYLGEVIDDRIDETKLEPLIVAFWRLFGQRVVPRTVTT